MGVEIVTSSDPVPQEEDACRYMEGLFNHFFTSDRQSYNVEDIEWFLEFSNEQKQWGTKLCEADVRHSSSQTHSQNTETIKHVSSLIGCTSKVFILLL